MLTKFRSKIKATCGHCSKFNEPVLSHPVMGHLCEDCATMAGCHPCGTCGEWGDEDTVRPLADSPAHVCARCAHLQGKLPCEECHQIHDAERILEIEGRALCVHCRESMIRARGDLYAEGYRDGRQQWASVSASWEKFAKELQQELRTRKRADHATGAIVTVLVLLVTYAYFVPVMLAIGGAIGDAMGAR